MQQTEEHQAIQRIFWDTQPVPRMGEYDTDQLLIPGPINETNEEPSKTPVKLIDMFEWGSLDMSNQDQLKQVYTLLAENYVEDDDAMFRFDYSTDFLKWALTPPGQFPDWLTIVKVKKSQKIIAFISAIPITMNVDGKKMKQAEINYLCVHKKLRKHRLAPVLIKEITRRVNCRNIWQAVYTAGVVIPTPISQAQYYHRNLNPKKLIEIGFSRLGKNQTISRLIKLYKLPEAPLIPGIRAMKQKDVHQVQQLLSTYQKPYRLFNTWDDEEVRHFFVPRKDVIYTYVVETEDKITDVVSFYSLPSSVLKHEKHTELRAAYSYYHANTTVSLEQLYNDALIFAHLEGFDVFNALDLMKNLEFIKELKFAPGDGYLSYYLYNWRVSHKMKAEELGMVLV